MKNPMVLSGYTNVPAMPPTDSEVNHLRMGFQLSKSPNEAKGKSEKQSNVYQKMRIFTGF